MYNKSNFGKLPVIAAACLIALLLQGFGWFNEEIDVRQTTTTNGLRYKLNDNDPFTGKVTNFPMAECAAQFKNGLLDGKTNCTSDGGANLLESEWKAGQKNGTEKVWCDHGGKLKAKTEWSNGKKDGTEERYNAYGDMVSQINWLNNQKAGSEKVWDLLGKTLLIDLRWKDGKQTGFIKEGEREENYKDGQFDGVRRHYAVRQDSGMSATTSAVWMADKNVDAIGGGAWSASMMKGYYIDSEQNYKNGILVPSK